MILKSSVLNRLLTLILLPMLVLHAKMELSLTHPLLDANHALKAKYSAKIH